MKSRSSLQRALPLCTPEVHCKPECLYCLSCSHFFCVECIQQHKFHNFIDAEDQQVLIVHMRSVLEGISTGDDEELQRKSEELRETTAICEKHIEEISAKCTSEYLKSCEIAQFYTENLIQIAIMNKQTLSQSLLSFKSNIFTRLLLAEREERAALQRLTELNACKSPGEALVMPRPGSPRRVPLAEVQKGLEWACCEDRCNWP